MLLLLVLGSNWTPVQADDGDDALELVENARLTFERFQTDPRMGSSVRASVQRAKGVLIAPGMQRPGFRGNGVFVARHQTKDMWTGPAFYALAWAGADADVSDVVIVALTDRGVAALLRNGGSLGAHANVMAGPVGVVAQTGGDIRADLVSYSGRTAPYDGVSLAGTIVSPLDTMARAYYGRPVTPTEILIGREVVSSQAAGLMAALDRVTGGFDSTRRVLLLAP